MGIELFLLGALVFSASLVGTLSGFGTSTIVVSTLLFFFPLPLTLLFVGTVHWFIDIGRMLLFRKGARKWRLLFWFAIPGVIASYASAIIPMAFSQEALLRVLGLFLLIYVFFILRYRYWKLPERYSLAALGGIGSGVAAGVFGIGGPIRSAWLTAFDLRKEAYLFASGAMAFGIDSARITGYLVNGTRLHGVFLSGLVLFIPLALLGALLAKLLIDRIPQKYFRIFIALFLVIAAIKFLLFP